MRCALINVGSGQVENLIVADPAFDKAPEGYLLVANPPPFVEIGTAWDGVAPQPTPAPPPAEVQRPSPDRMEML